MSLVAANGNLARNRYTKQISRYSNGYAYHAVDGNKNPVWSGKSCSSTSYKYKPWWMVDLGASKVVRVVKITNRGAGGGIYLKNFDVLVGNYATPASNAR